MPSLKSLGRLKHNSLQDVMREPGSRGCKVCTNSSCLGPCCLSFGNLSNRKVFSSPNNILSMQVVFFFFLMTFAKPWLLSCHECCQGLWVDPAAPAAAGAGFLPEDDHSWRVCVPWAGTKWAWWRGVPESWKRPWWRGNWFRFYRQRGEKQRSTHPGYQQLRMTPVSVLDSERRHPILGMRSE